MRINRDQSPLSQLPNVYRAFYGAFSRLHPAQIEAIDPILQGRDVLLQAKTGSGKTEAVLAPALERMIQSQQKTAVLYIVPTRALAFDLERRLTPIIRNRLGLRLGIRTGDVKRAGGKHPDVLLTTPESFDVVLGSSNTSLRNLTCRIQTVIIDEVHSFVHTYRGRQLAYLLKRLEMRLVAPLQKIILSATIADTDTVTRFFGFRTNPAQVMAPVQRLIAPYFVHIKNDDREFVALIDDLYYTWNYRKVLIFANNRGRCDRLFELLNRSSCFRQVCELHYSNLKSKERQAAEKRFRIRSQALCIATSTLELGIDIGDVDGVILYEPPSSISAFSQRIGRANRRQRQINFWGICRGDNAGHHLLRFLGLLRSAREGIIELPLPKELPSVLIQQILSCLYEKKRLSLPALMQLFPDTPEVMEELFAVMITKRWLRPDQIPGMVRGGIRYRDDFLERKIWSNFPEQEEDYILELSGESIADIPRSVIRQLEVGDRIQLAGQPIHILQIDEGKRKRLVAQPAEKLDNKEIFWLGPRLQVSHEVAQSIRVILDNPTMIETDKTQQFFHRIRLLWDGEKQAHKQVVRLKNGIEVRRTPNGLYEYRTFLGSLGNLLLHRSIEEALKGVDDLFVTSDEISVNSSHKINFQKLQLPTNRESLQHWVRQHQQALRAIFPLNAFASALPMKHLVQELVDFIFDRRILAVFSDYRTQSSEIAAGDITHLEWQLPEPQERCPDFLEIPDKSDRLSGERKRWKSKQKNGSVLDSAAYYTPRALTGTTVGEYIRLNQCERRLSFHFLADKDQPFPKNQARTEIQELRIERGRSHEENTLEYLRSQGHSVVVIRDSDASGNLLPLQKRCENTLTELENAMSRLRINPQASIFIAQAVLIVEQVLTDDKSWRQKVQGIGIPDLIRISIPPVDLIPQPLSQNRTHLSNRIPRGLAPKIFNKADVLMLEVGDIKASQRPQYHQKWQVAFYAELLVKLSETGTFSNPVTISPSGFILTLPQKDSLVEKHVFDLVPYLTAFPSLLQNMNQVLLNSPQRATYRLTNKCATCMVFDYCYGQALEEDDILFLPHLTSGTLKKLRQFHISTLTRAVDWINKSEGDQSIFTPNQWDRLRTRLESLQTKKICLYRKTTRSIPDNISTAVFLHVIADPLTAAPRGFGWSICDRKKNGCETRCCSLTAEDDFALIWQEFSAQVLTIQKNSVRNAASPHFFYFGEHNWEMLQTWKTTATLDFLWEANSGVHTNLHHLLIRHFDFPIPGRLTLSEIGRILGIEADLGERESLFHPDFHPLIDHPQCPNDQADQRIEAYLQNHLHLQYRIWQWMTSHLVSEQQRDCYSDPTIALTPETAHKRFIEEEQRTREDGILELQKYSLKERVNRFRALGPLRYSRSILDEEGRFLYELEQQVKLPPAKFREGDFLKLAALGTTDLQSGLPVILVNYDRNTGHLQIRSRRGKIALARNLDYSLEEELMDWNSAKLIHGIETVFSATSTHRLLPLFSGEWKGEQNQDSKDFIASWMKTQGAIAGLNSTQKRALTLPFLYNLSLISGPPGTGKTHLLAWTLIALMQYAKKQEMPLRIVVSALTHHAIDQVLRKVIELVNHHQLDDFPGTCCKWGRWSDTEQTDKRTVKPLLDAKDLSRYPYVILGATGFGLYQLFDSAKGSFPPFFDWVIFDEASQILVPQALLSLIYGKGNFLFLGDTKQLPPIILRDLRQQSEPIPDECRSILSLLQDWGYQSQQIQLAQTYRMNKEICAFPSRTWYAGKLQSVPEIADSRLKISGLKDGDVLDQVLVPDKPVVLLLVDHHNCDQKSDSEAQLVAEITRRLVETHGLDSGKIAIISPHRAQNNTILDYLSQYLTSPLTTSPIVDTVERMQGSEREVVIFSLTVSDLDQVNSEFINNPNRLNVAITRAKRKLIVIGSKTFFSAVAHSEEKLIANAPFKAFLKNCQDQHSVFYCKHPPVGSIFRSNA